MTQTYLHTRPILSALSLLLTSKPVDWLVAKLLYFNYLNIVYLWVWYSVS